MYCRPTSLDVIPQGTTLRFVNNAAPISDIPRIRCGCPIKEAGRIPGYGVVYHPNSEQGNYVPPVIPERCVFLFIDQTTALRAIDIQQRNKPPDTILHSNNTVAVEWSGDKRSNSANAFLYSSNTLKASLLAVVQIAFFGLIAGKCFLFDKSSTDKKVQDLITFSLSLVNPLFVF